MRFSCIEISFEDEDPYQRYTDMIAANRSSIRDESDLRDDFFEWQHGKDFQWFASDSLSGEDTNITVAFHESHPFFNCYMFHEALSDDPRNVEPLEVVESFMIPIYNKWVRREQAKRKRERAKRNKS